MMSADENCHQNSQYHCQNDHTSVCIWDTYNKRAQRRDKYLEEDWKGSINNVLLFAGILASAVTSLCVESRQLLGKDPQQYTKDILLTIAAKMDNSSLSALPVVQYEPELWHMQVNYLLFTSLTAALFAALGGIICLQWVGEYTDAQWVGEYTHGLANGEDVKTRALQRHSRFRRALHAWSMPRLIAGLHMMLLIAVACFLVGLAVWFWHTHRRMAIIPLTALLATFVGYTFMTLLAAAQPYAPYRTRASRGLVLGFSFSIFWLWRSWRAVICILQALSRAFAEAGRSRHDRRGWKSIQRKLATFVSEFRLSQGVAIQSYVKRVTDGYLSEPAWMASNKAYWRAVWGVRDQDESLTFATLAWLVSTLGQSMDVIDDLSMLMKELSHLDPSYLHNWWASRFDAPWMSAINFLLEHGEKGNEENIRVIEDVLLKMSNLPALFERQVVDMTPRTILFFVERLDANLLRNHNSIEAVRRYGPCAEDADSLEKAIIKLAENRLTSLTALLTANTWVVKGDSELRQSSLSTAIPPSSERLPGDLIPGILLDVLERYKSNTLSNAATLWVFTIYKTDESGPSAPSQSRLPPFRWPNPLVFGWDGLPAASLRMQAIIHYVVFLDQYLTGNRIATPGMRLQWHMPQKQPQTTRILTELLTHQLLRLHSDMATQLLGDEPSIRLLASLLPALKSPALKLICSIMDLNRLVEGIEIPETNRDSDHPSEATLWEDDDWKRAVVFWCGVRPGWDQDACALPRPVVHTIEKALVMVQKMARLNEPDLNNAAEELIYRFSRYMTMEHWIQLVSNLFCNKAEGYPWNVTSRLIDLLVRSSLGSSASLMDRFKAVIAEKIILPARYANIDPFQNQIGRLVANPRGGEEVQAADTWRYLVNEYSMKRRLKELRKRPVLPFTLDEMLKFIGSLLQPVDLGLELKISQFRAILAILNRAACHFLAADKRHRKLVATISSEHDRQVLSPLSLAPDEEVERMKGIACSFRYLYFCIGEIFDKLESSWKVNHPVDASRSRELSLTTSLTSAEHQKFVEDNMVVKDIASMGKIQWVKWKELWMYASSSWGTCFVKSSDPCARCHYVLP